MSKTAQKTYRITISEEEHFKILALKGKYGKNSLFFVLLELDNIADTTKNDTSDLKTCLLACDIDQIVLDAVARTKKDLKLFVKEAMEKKAMDEWKPE